MFVQPRGVQRGRRKHCNRVPRQTFGARLFVFWRYRADQPRKVWQQPLPILVIHRVVDPANVSRDHRAGTRWRIAMVQALDECDHLHRTETVIGQVRSRGKRRQLNVADRVKPVIHLIYSRFMLRGYYPKMAYVKLLDRTYAMPSKHHESGYNGIS
jgi:hypothetical protein